MSQAIAALEAITILFNPMYQPRRLAFSHATPTRRVTMRQRSTVSPSFNEPGPPYDLFRTMSHVIELAAAQNIAHDKVNRVVNVITDLFFMVEYTLEDPIEDLLSDSVITLHNFFRLYGQFPEYIDLSGDDTTTTVDYDSESDLSSITEVYEEYQH